MGREEYDKEWWEIFGDEPLIDRYEPDGYDMKHVYITPNDLYAKFVARLTHEFDLTRAAQRTEQEVDGG